MLRVMLSFSLSTRLPNFSSLYSKVTLDFHFAALRQTMKKISIKLRNPLSPFPSNHFRGLSRRTRTVGRLFIAVAWLPHAVELFGGGEVSAGFGETAGWAFFRAMPVRRVVLARTSLHREVAGHLHFSANPDRQTLLLLFGKGDDLPVGGHQKIPYLFSAANR